MKNKIYKNIFKNHMQITYNQLKIKIINHNDILKVPNPFYNDIINDMNKNKKFNMYGFIVHTYSLSKEFGMLLLNYNILCSSLSPSNYDQVQTLIKI